MFVAWAVATPTAAYTRSIAMGTPVVTAKLAALADATIEAAINEAALSYTQLANWGAKQTQVIALHALHILAISGALGTGQEGPVTSASAGGVSQSVGVNAVDLEGGLDRSTRWGRRALAILKGKAPSGRVSRAGTGYSPWL